MSKKSMGNDDINIFAYEGARAGAAYEAFVRAFTNTVADIEAAPLPSPEAYNGAFLAFYTHELNSQRQANKNISLSDCKRCWCDLCVNRERCIYKKGDDVAFLKKCEGCPLGKRYAPMEKNPPCGRKFKAVEFVDAEIGY